MQSVCVLSFFRRRLPGESTSSSLLIFLCSVSLLRLHLLKVQFHPPRYWKQCLTTRTTFVCLCAQCHFLCLWSLRSWKVDVCWNSLLICSSPPCITLLGSLILFFEGPIGITASSVSSLSMDPMTVTVGIHKGAKIFEHLRKSDAFVINILRDSQVHISNRFAKKFGSSEEQFKDLKFHLNQHGVPILESSVGSLECSVHSVLRVGDHNLVIAEVQHIHRTDDAEANVHRTLLYYDRGYHKLGDRMNPRGE